MFTGCWTGCSFTIFCSGWINCWVCISTLLVETDCPYLAPQKYRGTRNEPSYVVEVAKKDLKKASNITEEIIQLVDPYSETFDKSDLKKYQKLKIMIKIYYIIIIY